MDVRDLTFRGEDETKLYSCGKCGTCYSAKMDGVRARENAEKCCMPYTCSVCGIEVPRPWTMCEKHREQARLRRATPIPAKDWHDPVFSEYVSGDWGDGFSSEIDAMLEHIQDEMWGCAGPALLPVYCWPCKSEPLRIDAESALENAIDNMHEDAGAEVVDYDELVAFVEAWNAKQKCMSWHPDHSRVVVLDEARFAKLLEDE